MGQFDKLIIYFVMLDWDFNIHVSCNVGYVGTADITRNGLTCQCELTIIAVARLL